MVTPSAQMSTFSLVGGMSVALICPLITRSTGGRATTCAGREGGAREAVRLVEGGAAQTGAAVQAAGVLCGTHLPAPAALCCTQQPAPRPGAAPHLRRHVLNSAHRGDGRLLAHAHRQPKVALQQGGVRERGKAEEAADEEAEAATHSACTPPRSHSSFSTHSTLLTSLTLPASSIKMFSSLMSLQKKRQRGGGSHQELQQGARFAHGVLQAGAPASACAAQPPSQRPPVDDAHLVHRFQDGQAGQGHLLRHASLVHRLRGGRGRGRIRWRLMVADSCGRCSRCWCAPSQVTLPPRTFLSRSSFSSRSPPPQYSITMNRWASSWKAP